jgi:hypothetical protein
MREIKVKVLDNNRDLGNMRIGDVFWVHGPEESLSRPRVYSNHIDGEIEFSAQRNPGEEEILAITTPFPSNLDVCSDGKILLLRETEDTPHTYSPGKEQYNYKRDLLEDANLWQ